LDPARNYDVTVDGGTARRISGAALSQGGLAVALEDEWRASVIELEPAP
jgi:hypothetical protein